MLNSRHYARDSAPVRAMGTMSGSGLRLPEAPAVAPQTMPRV